MAHQYKKYIMDDGSIATVLDVMNVTGLSRPGAHRRLQLSRDTDWVFLPLGAAELQTHPIYGRNYFYEWENQEVKVAMGIPINPSYMDGMCYGEAVKDRDGNSMPYTKRAALSRYRDRLRIQWRKDRADTIQNLYIEEDEDDYI
jgi:hypothetical protein